MKKRFLSALLSLSVLLSMSTTTFAAGDIELSVDASDRTVSVGDTLTATIELSGNPGVESIQIDIIYDTDVLTCTAIKSGKILAEDGILYAGNKNNDGKASFAAISAYPIEEDGILVTLTFEAKANGTCTITPKVREILSDGKKVAAEILNDSVKVEGAQPETPSVSPEQTPESSISPENRPDIVFSDVPESHWAYSYIQNVVKQGLFTGISNNQFGPDMNVTRGMFVTVLYSNAGAPATEPSTFSDVAADAWYSKCVSWASEQGIVSGIGNNKFGPELSITREQLALILYQYAKGTSPGTEAYVRMFYPDGKEIHDWALTAMSWAVNEGLISGKTGNRLAPQDTATRAEVAVIMQNFVNMSK